MKRQDFFKALIFGALSLGGKLIGLIFIFRFASDIKEYGLYLYTYAYIPFSLFLDLSAFGLVPGISKMVSKLRANNELNKSIYLLKIGSIISLCIGVIFFILLNLFNEKILAVSLYEGYSDNEYNLILYHLKIASFTLLIFPLVSFYRGYLQGKLKAIYSGLSILIENIFRVLIYLYIAKDISIELISKVFIVNFVSYLISLLFLFLLVVKDLFKEKEKFKVLPQLLKNTIPFGIVTMFFTFYQLIDSITLSQLGMDAHIYTSYMFETNRLIFVPIAFAQSIGATLNPKINTLYQNNKIDEAKNVGRLITRFMINLLIPIILIFILYSKELYSLFYGNEELFYVLEDISILIFFIGFYKVIIGMASSMPKFNYVITATFIGAIAKFILNIILVSKYDYLGAIISTISAISICMLVAYYVLSKAKIKLFFSNIYSILISFGASLVSLYLTYLLRISISPTNNSMILETIIFISLFVLIYVLILSFVRFLRVTKKESHA